MWLFESSIVACSPMPTSTPLARNGPLLARLTPTLLLTTVLDSRIWRPSWPSATNLFKL